MNAKKNVLVVDDDPDTIEQIQMTLTAAGYHVTAAGSAEEAEEKLLAGKPDLAIVDLMMEQMDSGFVLSHYVKKLYPDTPVILLTAVTAATGISFNPQSPEAQSWIKVDKVIDKPVRAEQLKNEVRRLLKDPSDRKEPHA